MFCVWWSLPLHSQYTHKNTSSFEGSVFYEYSLVLAILWVLAILCEGTTLSIHVCCTCCYAAKCYYGCDGTVSKWVTKGTTVYSYWFNLSVLVTHRLVTYSVTAWVLPAEIVSQGVMGVISRTHILSRWRKGLCWAIGSAVKDLEKIITSARANQQHGKVELH